MDDCEFEQVDTHAWHCRVHGITVIQKNEPVFCPQQEELERLRAEKAERDLYRGALLQLLIDISRSDSMEHGVCDAVTEAVETILAFTGRTTLQDGKNTAPVESSWEDIERWAIQEQSKG